MDIKKAIRLAIFASGNGSNAENIANYFKDISEVEISLILTNKADAYVLERANNLNIKSFVFTFSELYKTNKVLQKLKDDSIDFVVLAGFMLKIPSNIISAFPNKIVNIHPALLPKYGGKGMFGNHVHEAVKAAGEKISGITIHFVNDNYDEGDIIFQAKVDILPCESADEIANKIHKLEYEYFPKTINLIINKLF
ncbi:MAG: phosphoribosylglycinamide formyltransferase [Bacteroidetes bacterium CG2_30_33_31]|nr:MAG: phosphoribosylglycinamide formyltransferase [Bacteroidetes bacterium CG2_30_33_31]